MELISAISIHAPRVGRDLVILICFLIIIISIHAPRVGRDFLKTKVHTHKPISIHAPRVGRDVEKYGEDSKNHNFNPRAPCGARPAVIHSDFVPQEISIHAPRVGRD